MFQSIDYAFALSTKQTYFNHCHLFLLFCLVWDNGICYRMATFHEAERTLWLKAIQMAPYDAINSQIVALKEKLNRIRAITDITTYRLQKGIVLGEY